MWEFFEDVSYYSLWAVRRVGDTNFNSQELFHVQSKEEAQALSCLLNGFELTLSNFRGGIQ